MNNKPNPFSRDKQTHALLTAEQADLLKFLAEKRAKQLNRQLVIIGIILVSILLLGISLVQKESKVQTTGKTQETNQKNQ